MALFIILYVPYLSILVFLCMVLFVVYFTQAFLINSLKLTNPNTSRVKKKLTIVTDSMLDNRLFCASATHV